MRSSKVKVASLPLGETDCETLMVPKKFTVEPAGIVVEELLQYFQLKRVDQSFQNAIMKEASAKPRGLNI